MTDCLEIFFVLLYIFHTLHNETCFSVMIRKKTLERKDIGLHPALLLAPLFL